MASTSRRAGAALLSAPLLERFERALGATGAPASGALRPGLSDAEIESRAAEAGLTLPEEARTWWRWHDGTNDSGGVLGRDIGPMRMFYSLKEALAQREEILTMMQGVGGPAVERWPNAWLPLIHGNDVLAIDTAGGRSAPAPVHQYFFHEGPKPADLPSLGALVTVWTDAIISGGWYFSTEHHRWERRNDRLPASLLHRGVV